MKILLLCFTWLLASMSYAQTSVTPGELINTKWISPVSDSCVTSLCFNSDRTVVFQECGDDWSWEVGYTLSENLIILNVSQDLTNKMTFRMDEGILRLVSTMKERYPKSYIRVPDGKCD